MWIRSRKGLLFRHKVFSLLRKAGAIDEDRIALLLSWKHSGFSIHNSVTVEPENPLAVERLVRYLMRPPVSLERVVFDPESGEVSLQPKASSDDGAGGEEVARIDPDELVARVIAQIPDPKRYLIRNYGRYANAARAKRQRDVTTEGGSPAEAGVATRGPQRLPRRDRSTPAERKAAGKRWANLIRHIYEVDPLVCPRCGGAMKIISFITERRVIRAILDSVRRSGTPASAGSLHPPPAARPAEAGVH